MKMEIEIATLNHEGVELDLNDLKREIIKAIYDIIPGQDVEPIQIKLFNQYESESYRYIIMNGNIVELG